MADENLTNTQSVNSEDKPAEVAEPEQSKADKTIEKLQKRISDISQNKNETKEKLDQALAEIEKLKNKSDNPDRDADNDSTIKKQDEQIKQLQAQLDREHRLSEARDIFSKAGQNVSDDILQMVTTDDEKQTYQNISAILKYNNATITATKKRYYSDSTPRINSTAGSLTKADIAKIKDPVKRVQAIKENLKLYKH